RHTRFSRDWSSDVCSSDLKDIDRDFQAVILSYDSSGFNLLNNEDISKIQLTPPAALEFLLALEEEREVDCVSCKRCGYPHLDLRSEERRVGKEWRHRCERK